MVKLRAPRVIKKGSVENICEEKYVHKPKYDFKTFIKNIDLSKIKRVIIEVCCGSQSKMGMYWKDASEGCLVIRVTMEHDFTTTHGLQYVLDAIEYFNKLSIPILLWFSLPCTGGCRYKLENDRRYADPEKNPNHLRYKQKQRNTLAIWSKLWDNACLVSQKVLGPSRAERLIFYKVFSGGPCRPDPLLQYRILYCTM